MSAATQTYPALRIVDLITDDESRKFEPVGRMAAAIIEISRAQGDCLPQDLNAKGFASDEIAEHWHMAQSLAAVELKLMSRHRQIKNSCRTKTDGLNSSPSHKD